MPPLVQVAGRYGRDWDVVGAWLAMEARCGHGARKAAKPVLKKQVGCPSRRSESPIRVTGPSQLCELLSRVAIRAACPSHLSESPIRVDYSSRLSESPV